MRSETETDRATDCSKETESGNQSGSDIEVLEWKRANPNNKLIKKLENAVGIAAGIIGQDIKRIEKQIFKIKKMR